MIRYLRTYELKAKFNWCINNDATIGWWDNNDATIGWWDDGMVGMLG